MVREAWARNLYSCLGKWWCQLLTGASDEPFDLMHLSDDGVWLCYVYRLICYMTEPKALCTGNNILVMLHSYVKSQIGQSGCLLYLHSTTFRPFSLGYLASVPMQLNSSA